MELKLNIYDGDEAIKTYTAHGYRLKMGTIEELLKLIDIDKFKGVDLTNTESIKSNNDVLFEILKIVVKGFPKFRPLLMDVFKGLTADEYENIDPAEVAAVLINIVVYTFGRFEAAFAGKN